MAVQESYVNSSLENNPRWSAPEVVAEGRFSKEADVYSFGIILWELLTWQEPWSAYNSFQIMIALRDGVRPQIPPIDELPGQGGALACSPAAAGSEVARKRGSDGSGKHGGHRRRTGSPCAVAEYIRLLMECLDE
ncbi:Putative serine/threonine-protein kinase/receptor [Monoraphidium neglectum]|uniref:Putative serine/threonine-protein kinase/receptor n=1 Tax=Monoraphidium neglectum TaxID=145388 RepID=A0A0D2K582_9CHLO|nr:Putative serine/threonine-protein kinase/receptor [Monoraphidium neglectum]KIY91303.1 Putative serine/threonine-protein kinase/receptor [Monoraphidium neglectum]|eukprot:XP_013890323.1 Putative serine/threonine-protein kinase/receptor [Monoraphidium neglectum]